MKTRVVLLFLIIIFFPVSCGKKVSNGVIKYYYVPEANLILQVQSDSINNCQDIDICEYVSTTSNHPDSSYVLGRVVIPLNSSGCVYLPLLSSKEKYSMACGKSIITYSKKACFVRLSERDSQRAKMRLISAHIPIVNDKLVYELPTNQIKYTSSMNDRDIEKLPLNRRLWVATSDFKLPEDIKAMFESRSSSDVASALYICDANSFLYGAFVYKGSVFKPRPYYLRDGLFSGDYPGGFFLLNPYYHDCLFYCSNGEPYDGVLTGGVSVIELTSFVESGMEIYDRNYGINPPWIGIDLDYKRK